MSQMRRGLEHCNDTATCFSWIDHVLCSSVVEKSVSSCKVLYEYVSSDHKPLMVTFTELYPNCKLSAFTAGHSDDCNRLVFGWSKVDDSCIAIFQSELDSALSKVNIPSCLLTVAEYDSNANCDSSSLLSADVQKTRLMIDGYYGAVMNCVANTSVNNIPRKTAGPAVRDQVPGWNDIVEDKHALAREAFLN